MAELAGVSRTASAVAAARARESARPDRLFDDPYARHLAKAGTSFWMPGKDPDEVIAAHGDYFALRTRFFDTYLQDAAKPQVVIFGAGFDTRAYRLAWPATTTVFELDLPPVLEHKAAVMAADQPACRRRVPVAVDLTDDWPRVLRDHGHDPNRDTAWLAEGLLMYLGEDNVQRLLTAAHTLSTPDSVLAVEHFGFSLDAKGISSVAEVGKDRMHQLVTKGTRGPQALAQAGWTVTVERDIPGLAHEHGRPVPPRWAAGSERAARARLLTARPG